MPFPSPADDYFEKRLNLNDLIVHPSATYFVRMKSLGMEPTLQKGDVLIVDRALMPLDYQIVLVRLRDTFMARRILTYDDGYLLLLADNPAFVEIEITEQADFQLWGVVTYIIRKLQAPTKRRRHR